MTTGWLHISGHDLWSDLCASTARPRSSTSTASVERPPASEISYVARIRLRWGGRVAKKWQNMTREGRAWCPPKLMTSWYEQPLMRLQLNTKLTCINLSSSFPLIHWNISKLGSWASRIIYFCENTHCLRIKNSQHLISTFIKIAQFLERIETPALILNRHHHKTGLNFFCI